MSHVVVVLGLALAPVLLAACSSESPSQVTPTKNEEACPRLDSRLRELAANDRPADFARASGLDLNSSGVRVIVEVADGADIPASYSVAVEGRYGSQIQARIPPERLCALAGEAVVRGITPPAPHAPL